MIKYTCDKCGKDVQRGELRTINLYLGHWKDSITPKPLKKDSFDICNECDELISEKRIELQNKETYEICDFILGCKS